VSGRGNSKKEKRKGSDDPPLRLKKKKKRAPYELGREKRGALKRGGGIVILPGDPGGKRGVEEGSPAMVCGHFQTGGIMQKGDTRFPRWEKGEKEIRRTLLLQRKKGHRKKSLFVPPESPEGKKGDLVDAFGGRKKEKGQHARQLSRADFGKGGERTGPSCSFLGHRKKKNRGKRKDTAIYFTPWVAGRKKGRREGFGSHFSSYFIRSERGETRNEEKRRRYAGRSRGGKKKKRRQAAGPSASPNVSGCEKEKPIPCVAVRVSNLQWREGGGKSEKGKIHHLALLMQRREEKGKKSMTLLISSEARRTQEEGRCSMTSTPRDKKKKNT